RDRARGDDGRVDHLRARHGAAPRRRSARDRAGAGRRPLAGANAMSAIDLSLREQAAGIAAGEIDPGELLDECLARVEERDPDLNAVVATFPQESRRMLDEAPDGPLRGVPVVIKDEWPLPWRAERVGAASVLADIEAGES